MRWSRKWSIAIRRNFQKITVVIALFTKRGDEWFIIRWRQTFFKRLLDWRANLSAQATGCRQGAIIQFGVQNPDFRSKFLNIYLKQGETNFCFKDLCRVSSLQQSGIWRRSWILNFRALSSARGDIEYVEYLKFEWIHATSKPLCISPASQHWASSARGKTELKKFVGSIWKYKSDILTTIHLFYLNSNKTSSTGIRHFIWVEFYES